jgi:hypothetical protein
MTGARGATSCMVCCAQDHSIVANCLEDYQQFIGDDDHSDE